MPISKFAAEKSVKIRTSRNPKSNNPNMHPRAAREITNALRQFQSAVEKVALEQQVDELKAQLKELKKRWVA